MAESIFKTPPEIFPLIASYLPLQHLPATLLAFSRTCRDIYSYVHPVLWNNVIVKNEDDASQLLESIASDPTLGRLIRGLRIRIDLTVEISKRRSKTTVLLKLQEVIEQGTLPNLNFFQLVLLKFDYNKSSVYEFKFNDRYSLPRNFWQSLRKYCPLLHGVCIHGVGNSNPAESEWINDPDFYDLKDFLGLRTFALKFHHGYPRKECSERLCRNIFNLASSLQCLTLFFKGYQGQEAGPLLSLVFPHLKTFIISGIKNTTEQAMNFWIQHPNLERVNIHRQEKRWFSDGIEIGFLPKLRHLRAQFNDVRALATHLGQLEHLSITKSYNSQVPYLLRSVITEGLPDLKSLEIHQDPSNGPNILSVEGGGWSETEDGRFIQATTPGDAWRRINNSYIRSIVRGAPNLQELYVGRSPPSREPIEKIAATIGQLRFLEQFYYRAFDNNIRVKYWALGYEPRMVIEKDCRVLGTLCSSLRNVTDVSFFKNGPYVVGNIIRGDDGSVKNIALGRGFGMQFTGGDDDPFPLNKSPIYDWSS